MCIRIAVVMGGIILFSPLDAETLRCEDPLFQVKSTDAEVLDRTCQAASESRRKLATCGVTVDRPIEISVLDRVEGEIGECLGIFHCEEDRIEIITPSSIGKVRDDFGTFGQISDDAFWESIIVHELTHAAYAKVPCPFSSCLATSEYAAFAMQTWSLPEAERELLEPNADPRVVPSREAISALMYLFSPDRFAFIAWQHFQSQPDPCAFMAQIMSGRERFDIELFNE